MSRNKYPEVTVDKILEVSERLFLEKGYENTTIQDIVDGLGGLTKGAVYHHFQSKEEIMEALAERLFGSDIPFALVQERTDLNGLQKMKLAMRLNQENAQKAALAKQALPLLQNPRILAEMLEADRRFLCPRWKELIDEGIRDGSVTTAYPQEMAELLVLLELWMTPSVFPGDKETMVRRYRCAAEMFSKMGLPLFDEASEEAARSLPYWE